MGILVWKNCSHNRGITRLVYLYNLRLMETDFLENVEVIAGYEDRLKPMTTIFELIALKVDYK